MVVCATTVDGVFDPLVSTALEIESERTTELEPVHDDNDDVYASE